jgi:hypothetical protein
MGLNTGICVSLKSQWNNLGFCGNMLVSLVAAGIVVGGAEIVQAIVLATGGRQLSAQERAGIDAVAGVIGAGVEWILYLCNAAKNQRKQGDGETQPLVVRHKQVSQPEFGNVGETEALEILNRDAASTQAGTPPGASIPIGLLNTGSPKLRSPVAKDSPIASPVARNPDDFVLPLAQGFDGFHPAASTPIA